MAQQTKEWVTISGVFIRITGQNISLINFPLSIYVQVNSGYKYCSTYPCINYHLLKGKETSLLKSIYFEIKRGKKILLIFSPDL